MRDEEERDLLLEQELLHPEDRIEVEVVRRFVQEEEGGLGGQGPGEEAAAFQAPGEVVEGAVLGEAEAGNQVVDAEILLPVLRQVVGPEAGGDDLSHRARQMVGNLLGQAGDADSFRDGDRARVGGGLAGGQAHEGRLARPIATQQADSLPFLDLQVEVVEDGGTAEADVDIEQAEQGHSALK